MTYIDNTVKPPLTIRLVRYFVGLFIMTIGISFSVKSNLGVSPVSSIPYTLTCCIGLEMGKATILLHCFLVLLQVIILGKSFKAKMLLQIPVGIVFGYFTTFCNYLAGFLPSTSNLALRLLFTLVSVFFIAFGIFLYLPADIVPLAGEGFMQAVSQVSGVEFPKVKIATDVSMVTLSLVTCLIVLHKTGSVGMGTVIAAFLVGTVLGFITKIWKKLGKSAKENRKSES